MIGRFYDSIKKDNDARKVPNSVIKELNKELPTGFSYNYDEEKGHLVIQESPGSNDKMVVEINLQDEGIPSNIPPNRVMEYIYRSQKTVHLKNAKIEKEGKTLYLREMNVDPVTGEGANEEGFEVLIPMKFPQASPLYLKTEDETEIEIMFRRQPYESMEAIKLANESFPALKIQWIVPEKRWKTDEKGKRKEIPATMTMTVKVADAESVEDAIIALKVYKSFLKGTLLLNEKLLGKVVIDKEVDLNSVDEHISYWTDLKRIEDIIGVKFSPGAEMTEKERELCLELIEMLVYDKNVVFKEPFTHFHLGEIKYKGQEISEEDLLGKENIGFSFTNGPDNYSLLGAEFALYEAVSMVGLKIDQIIRDSDGKGAEIYISSSKDTTWKLIRRYCLSIEEADEVQRKMYETYQTLRR